MPTIDLGKVVGDSEIAKNAEKLGGKAPEYYLSPHNLLDNSNFRNPVNQRGVSGTISTAGYFIDRWKLVSGSVTIGADGLMLNGTIAQILENSPGTVTASANAGTATFDASSNTFSLTGSGVVVEWAALYEGSYTAATLPPYVPKGYAAELAECQRYYYGTESYVQVLASVTNYGKSYYVSLPMPTKMRDIPTVDISLIQWVGVNGQEVSLYGTSITHTISHYVSSKNALLILILFDSAPIDVAGNQLGYMALSYRLNDDL